MIRPIAAGTIIVADIPDVNGFRKVRPAVVIKAGDPLLVVPVSTVVPDPLPADQIPLPSDPTGRARTGLRRRSVAVGSWATGLPADKVIDIIGVVPTPLIAVLLAALPKP